VNAREIFTSKCAEYSPTNETIGATLSLFARLWQKQTRLERPRDPGYAFAHPGYGI